MTKAGYRARTDDLLITNQLLYHWAKPAFRKENNANFAGGELLSIRSLNMGGSLLPGAAVGL